MVGAAKQYTVQKVHYIELRSHPHHELASSIMKGKFGGLVTFELSANRDQTTTFVDSVNIPIIATGFGGVQPSIEQPAIFTYHSATPDERAHLGITENLMRLSVGLEDPEELIADLKNAMEFALPS